MGDDAVVVVEGLVDGYGDALGRGGALGGIWESGRGRVRYHVIVGDVGAGLLVPLRSCVGACSRVSVPLRVHRAVVWWKRIPTTRVSLGNSSKKHFGCVPSM